jgi:hypothetical protein
MEVTVKLRLLRTSALFLFAQMATMQAQETLDIAKIACEGKLLGWLLGGGGGDGCSGVFPKGSGAEILSTKME